MGGTKMKKITQTEKRRNLAIILLLAFLILFVIVNYMIQKNGTKSENVGFDTPSPVTTDSSSDRIRTVTATAGAITAYQEKRNWETLENDCIRFINAYTATTTGTYASAKRYYDTLAPLMTKSAAENYLDLDTLKNPDSFAEGENPTAKIENDNITVYVLSKDILAKDTVSVYVSCDQSLQSDGAKTSYLYHFKGDFKYFSKENRWKCSSIQKATIYTE